MIDVDHVRAELRRLRNAIPLANVPWYTRAMDQIRQQQVRHVIDDAVMPYALARAAVPYLKQTPEYQQARAEKRSREWLDRESLSIGYAMADILRNRLDDLDS